MAGGHQKASGWWSGGRRTSHFRLSAARETSHYFNLTRQLSQKSRVGPALNQHALQLPKEAFTLAGKSTMMVNDSPLEKQRFPDLIWHESNEKDVGTFHRKKVPPTSFSFLLLTLEQLQMLLKRLDFGKQLQVSLKSRFVGGVHRDENRWRNPKFYTESRWNRMQAPILWKG